MISVGIYSKTIPVLGLTQLSSPVLGGFVPYPTSFSEYSSTNSHSALFVLGRHQFGVILLKWTLLYLLNVIPIPIQIGFYESVQVFTPHLDFAPNLIFAESTIDVEIG